MAEGALSWTSLAWQAFVAEAEDVLSYDEETTEEGELSPTSIFFSPAGRADWFRYAHRTDETDTEGEIRCILTLARFLRPHLNRIEYWEEGPNWKGFGRWFLKTLDNASPGAGPICQVAIRARRTNKEGKKRWAVISEILVAKLVQPEETPLPDVIWELKIHELVTTAAAVEKCDYIVPLRGGGPDRSAHCFTVLTDRAEYGNLEQVITRHSQDHDSREVPEAFIWYLLHALSQAALIMERGGIAGPRDGWNKEVVHLDIRPANIVLHWPNRQHFRRYPTPKLIDFGAAVATDDEDTRNPYSWAGEGAASAAAPEMYWGDWAERRKYEDRNPLTATRSHRLTSKTNVYQIGLVARRLMTCSGNEAQEFSFEDEEEPENGEDIDWELDDSVCGRPAPPDYTIDVDAEPEDEDDGKPDEVGPIVDGEAGYKDMEWREPHDVTIGSYSPELVKLVNCSV
ncbi:hypothetical protein SLS57_005065 [Botryosphaeria dothidea]